jgi:hypothetical protein
MAARGRPKGTPKTGGRKAGTPNKTASDIKELAQKYGASAISELARLSFKAESEQTRVAAIKELLNRGYGQAPATVNIKRDVAELSDAELYAIASSARIAGTPASSDESRSLH